VRLVFNDPTTAAQWAARHERLDESHHVTIEEFR
jgi:hypothetical protein